MSERGAVRAAVALAWGLASSVCMYGISRAVQSASAPPMDPAAPAWSAHVGYFWRLGTATYAGGIVAFIAYLVGGRHLPGLARSLGVAVAVSAAVLTLQIVFLP